MDNREDRNEAGSIGLQEVLFVEDKPIRGELFSSDQLAEQAKRLALDQQINPKVSPDTKLLRQFQRNARFLQWAYSAINKAVADGEPLIPAEEWFIDNFHIISDQLRAITEDLPKDFYLELIPLASGNYRGYPRVYQIALDLILHTDSRIDQVILRQYIGSYQTVSTLKTGELWAIATLLRLGLIENLKRLILLSEKERDARRDANRFADRLIAAGSPAEIDALLNERSQDPRRIGGAFALQLILRLRDEPPAHFAAVEWLYKQLSKAGIDPDQMIRHKHHDLAGAQISVSNAIRSLRLLAAMDWSELVEEVSAVDSELRNDPAGFYSKCDFPTRDRYRHAIEDIARGSSKSETEVAAIAIEMAEQSLKADPPDSRKSHVGYYLIGNGREDLERACSFLPGFGLRVRRFVSSWPVLFYQFPILLLTLSLSALAATYVTEKNAAGWLLVAVLCFIPASSLATLVVNWIVTLLVKPKILPKLEFKDDIPRDYKTIVVLPTLLARAGEGRELAAKLEVLYLANNEDIFDFGLLTDFADAATAEAPTDAAFLAETEDAIHALNNRYPRSEGPRFHIFHRIRLWNELEGKWMGWERKRGKLEEFNRLLQGDRNTTYGAVQAPRGIRFVITLDSDTVLPRDAGRRMIGTIAHPLNQPVLDPITRKVVEGYAILQPRVSHAPVSSNKSWYSRIFSGYAGIDPYTTAVSDIYQDLFVEGSFIGKGLYDLKAFSDSVGNRFPENALLSHDLIEGSFARTAIVTDIEIFDDHPSDYTSSMLRLHRWVRGDWQVARWLFRYVPGPDGKPVRNTLSWLNRLKLIDNLRRSLVSPALYALLLTGWLAFPDTALFWSMAAAGILFAPLVVQFISGLLSTASNARWIGRIWGLGYDAVVSAVQSILQLCFLANEAWIMSDAILRTLWRMIRRRKLLEWLTAAQAERARRKDLLAYFHGLYGSFLLTVPVFLLLLTLRPESFPAALPILFLWVLAPALAYATGHLTPRKKRNIPEDAVPVLRSYARDIWRYFDTFVNSENHWLPPDNFQEIPEETIAHRTSPTNIAFLLLSNISAYDFGFIGAVEFLDRTEKTLETLTELRTFNGHFFNWYDTRTLAPLEPRYVSTADSGNLAAALIVLKQFTLRFGLNVAKAFEPRTGRYLGVRDTFSKFFSTIEKSDTVRNANAKILKNIQELLATQPDNTDHQEQLLHALNAAMKEMKLPEDTEAEQRYWLDASLRVVATHLADYETPQDIPRRLLALSREAEAVAEEIDFQFLYNEKRGIFSIGFNVTDGRLDPSSYDLFASEARLASFAAIAKGDVPQSHWFRMARAMASVGRRRILVSWSGSLFEYLMPLLFLQNEPLTLLDVTYRGAVDMHRMYGFQNEVPWGISEAAYNFRDLAHNYQYGPFGVPDIGLKRGLSSDLVITPYSTFLAMMVHPKSAIQNLEHFKKLKMYGRYGFYESIDYTPDRLLKGEKYAIVRTFMAHHQGMSLVALDNVLHHDRIQKRFHSDPAIEATSLLLQEKMPLAVRSRPLHIVDERPELFREAEPAAVREFNSPYVTPPRTQILSNGNYMVVATTSGSGYGEWKGIRIGRWREDVSRDNWGTFLYIKDRTSDRFWSAGFQPTLKKPDQYRVVYGEDKVEIRRSDAGIETEMDIAVSPEDNAEIRRLTLVNTTDESKEFEITSYMEVVLAAAAADLAHPAFMNLFVETEYDKPTGVLLAYRRPRSLEDPVYWAAHVMMCEDLIAEIEHETDRARFIGRNRSIVSPQALDGRLSNTAGAVLDPIFSLRGRIELPPYTRKTLAFTTLIANSKEEALALCEKYRNSRGIHRAFELASAHVQVMLRQLSIPLEEAHLFQRIAGRLIYSDISLRPSPTLLARNTRSQSALWPYGISGDLPICLVRVEDQKEIEIVRQMLRAHDYWRLKGLIVDLVILNEYPSSYFQELQEELNSVVRNSPSHVLVDKPGGIFIRRADLMSEEDKILLRSIARVQIVAQRGSIARQAARRESKDPLPPLHIPLSQFPLIDPPVSVRVPELFFHNGFGGFTADGKEFVVAVKEGFSTPAPWINIISNPEFGFLISETGSGTTWSVNSRENRLTPWSNDAVTDPPDSIIYIRDEESGVFWTPTPKPVPAPGSYVVAHGSGYTRFNSGGYGIDQELLLFVPEDAPVKILRLRLRNTTRRSRKLSVTHYSELVLGVSHSQSAPFVISSIDPQSGALLATNPFNNEFAGRVAFSWMNDKKRTVTADRTFFLGENGDPSDPAAMSYAHLAGHVGAGIDPCAAVQGQVDLPPLSEHTVIFLFGQASDLESARNIISRFNNAEAVQNAYANVYGSWEKLLSALQIKTPDAEMNTLMNRWLLYQTYSCRFWGRSAFYQGGGAFGFRDQLQDSMAFVYSSPSTVRQHLLRAASRQFVEGDVQHWWHPPTGRGVRTRISDDLLWLPYVVAHYIRTTGDQSVLDEKAPYLQGPPLEAHEMEAYFQPEVSKISGNLYEHCIKTIEYSLKFGAHGLPLIGSGDWNDGMNRLGIHGKGESVWLAWFLIVVLNEFAEICDRRFDAERSESFRENALRIEKSLEKHAWDGSWYVRGFDDEGNAFGSSKDRECRIDSIAQTWSVLSQAADPARALKAMQSVEEFLLNIAEEIALLFTPPFVHTPRDPGYIRGYLAGIRENGGQYTHAATWLVAAYAELGLADQALKVFHMCSPITHSHNRQKAEKYKLEPYVVAGDIYSHPSHMGRGGWSWYTGSAAWLYRVALESILGFRLRGDHLLIRPCIPANWPSFEITYRIGKSTYHIHVKNQAKHRGTVASIEMDQQKLAENSIRLVDDQRNHTVVIQIADSELPAAD